MNDNIVLFAKKLSEDAELQKKLQSVTSPEEAFEIASAVQDGFTKEEFLQAAQAVKAQMENGELTDEDLAKAAGGMTKDERDTALNIINFLWSTIPLNPMNAAFV